LFFGRQTIPCIFNGSTDSPSTILTSPEILMEPLQAPGKLPNARCRVGSVEGEGAERCSASPFKGTSGIWKNPAHEGRQGPIYLVHRRRKAVELRLCASN